MSNNINSLLHSCSVSFIPEDLRTAEEIAFQHDMPSLRSKTFLDVLAVLAVEHRFRSFGVPSDLSKSNTLNPAIQVLLGARDLFVQNRGRFECIPVLPGEKKFKIPLDLDPDTIACVAVQFEEELSEVTILGYTPVELSNSGETISLDALESGIELIEFAHASPEKKTSLTLLPSTPAVTNVVSIFNLVPNKKVNLGRAASAESHAVRDPLNIETVLAKSGDLSFCLHMTVLVKHLGQDQYFIGITIKAEEEAVKLPVGISLFVSGSNDQIQGNSTREPKNALVTNPIQVNEEELFTYRVSYNDYEASGSMSVRGIIQSVS